MKKVIALMLTAIIMLPLFCGCTNVKHKDYTVDRFTDSSVSQQRWLRDPETDLVINPAEYNDAETPDNNRLGLNIGYLDAESNVTKTLDNVLFLMEALEANAKVGDPVFSAVWDTSDPNCNIKYSATKMTIDTSVPDRTAIDGLDLNTNVIQFASNLPFRWDVDFLAIIDVLSVSSEAHWSLQVSVSAGSNRAGVTLQPESNEAGKKVFNLTEIVKANLKNADEEPSAKLNLLLRIGAESESELLPHVVIGDYKIIAVPRTLTYSENKPSTSWAPYGLYTSLEYPNGSAATALDYFAVDATDEANVFKNVVTRKITYTGAGLLYLGGKAEGKVEWNDSKVWIMVENDGYKFVICPKKKQGLQFFSTEADMMNRRNGTEVPTETTAYWSVPLGNYAVDDSIFVTVAFGTADESFEDLGEKARSVVTSSKAEKYLDRAMKFWDWYLKRAELPDTYVNYSEPVA